MKNKAEIPFVVRVGSADVGGWKKTGDRYISGALEVILNKCEDWAKDRGCEKFTASCNIDDEQAMNLYNYSGFSEISKVAYFSKELNI